MSDTSQLVAKLSALAKQSADEFIEGSKAILDPTKTDRARELVKDIAQLQMDKLMADDEDKALYDEMIADKLGSMEHVLVSEAIVASRELAAQLAAGARGLVTGAAVVGKEFVKASLAGIGGPAGGVAARVGEKVIDTAAKKALDKISDAEKEGP